MRVVVLPSWYPTYEGDAGGVFFREQAMALTKAGLQVEVIAPRRLSLRQVFRRRKPLTGFPGMKESRWNYVGLPRMAEADGFIWRTLATRLYSEYLQRHGPPDILHAHSLYPAGMLAARLPARARVITEHLSTFLAPQNPMTASSASEVLRQFAVRIAVGRELGAAMERMAPSGGAWKIVPNLVDTEFFSPKVYPVRPIRVLTVSYLTANKRVDWIIHAFDLVFGHSDAVLHIIGDGEQRSSLERQAARLGSRSRIRFLGKLSRSQVRDQLDQSTIFALASRRETFGVVLLEAMSMGRPVLATNSGGPAAIVNERVGVLTDVDDFAGFVEGLRRLASTLDSYSPASIREHCRSNFSDRAVTSTLIAIYAESLRNDPPTV